MANKFNKLFNSTTINGRANVAKVTYASFALMYLFYRIRKRGSKSAQPKDTNGSSVGGKEGDCGCHGTMVSPNAKTSTPATPPASSKNKEDCSVCRDRAPKQNKDNQTGQRQGNNDTTTKRRKCPCEDPHLHTDSDEWMLRQREYEANEKHEGCASYTPGMSITEDKPTTNMHETIYNALRGMLGAVMGGNESSNGVNGNVGNDDTDFFKIRKDKNDKSDNAKNDNDNNNKGRTKDDDYLDGIGPDMYCED